MIAALLLQAGDLPPPALPPDWSVLAAVPYAQAPMLAPSLSSFVAGEIAAGKCAVPRPADGHYVVRVDVATLVSADGTVRRAVPHAIDCPSVQRFTGPTWDLTYTGRVARCARRVDRTRGFSSSVSHRRSAAIRSGMRLARP